MGLLPRAIRVAVGACLLATIANVANTQQVVLSSPDGAVVLAGQLRSFSDGFYELDTDIGSLRVDSALVSCEGAACPEIKPPTAVFSVSGSAEMAQTFFPQIVERYARAQSAKFAVSADDAAPKYVITDQEGDDLASIQLRATNSSLGLSDLILGDSAIALSTRPVRRREADTFEGSGLGDIREAGQEFVVALDGLVIVTSQENPLRSITEEDAALVFAGTYTNWSQIGGPDAPIRAYIRGEDSGSGEVFSRLLMAPQGVSFGPNATVVLSDDDVGRLVAQDPFGIGFTSFAGRGEAKPLAIQGVCGLVSEPSEFNIKTEEYALTRRLYAYTTNEEKSEQLEGLLNFAIGQEGQNIVADAGFVGQTISQSTVSEQGMRFATAIIENNSLTAVRQLGVMVSDMVASSRLSTTFRFETGSSRLDTRALDDIDRLADELVERNTFKKVVQLIGFTDSVGEDALNVELSRRRALQVQEALLAARPDLTDRIEVQAIGYGEISPLACNETVDGRRINRRVEVWIRESF